eukprot:CAMPEP_0185843222 /NCGR_PEP_ID=MMETSP1353-20130828/18803_1 /TAXON_ID=1077150 /ORGANISM="Erythrolobus australicus, Strain CCMP3124" /LENGTH=255 /DNA_ID=CAMNT_0028542733 /DNA_START=1 /DNA_END=768 /DNA_ORIENTATION=+
MAAGSVWRGMCSSTEMSATAGSKHVPAVRITEKVREREHPAVRPVKRYRVHIPLNATQEELDAIRERTLFNPTFMMSIGPAARQMLTRKLTNRSYPYEEKFGPRMIYQRRRNAQHRARALLRRLNEEEATAMKESGRAVIPNKIPDLQAGDVIRLRLRNPNNSEVDLWFTGMVIARRNSGTSSTFVVRNAVDGVAVERLFPLYSPTIKDVELLERRKQRLRKLLFLRRRDVDRSNFGDTLARPANLTYSAQKKKA